jgi:hypothetical protein
MLTDSTDGYAELAVVVNSAPTSGTFSIDPSDGVVLETAFQFGALKWIDDAEDLPLLYAFYYMIYGSTTEYQLVSNTPATSYDGALLPRGGGNSSVITGVAYISDQLEATASESVDVVCAPVSITVTELSNMTGQMLASSFESGNVEGVFQVMVASSSVLNAVNCTTVSCGPLLREICDEQDNVCGDCIDGFYGFDGPSNVPCYAIPDSCTDGVWNNNETDTDCGGDACAPCETGSSCAIDVDCEYVLCDAGVCEAPVKLCTNNCTGHGNCYHKHVSGTTMEEETCTADMTSCSPICECDGGWYADDCSLDELGYAEVTALRDDMVDALTQTTDMQDVETSTLNQQSSSLSSLAADSSELSSSSTLVALDLAAGISEGSSGLGLASGTSDAVGATISTLLDTSLLSGNISVGGPTSSPTLDGSVLPTASAPPTSSASAIGSNRTSRLLAELAPTTLQHTGSYDSGVAQPTFAPTIMPRMRSESFMRRRNRRLEEGSNAEAALGSVTSTLASLSSAHLYSAVAGEAASTVTTSNIRMASQRNFARSIGSASLTTPLSEDDIEAGKTAPSLQLGSSIQLAYDDDTAVSDEANVDVQVQRVARHRNQITCSRSCLLPTGHGMGL